MLTHIKTTKGVTIKRKDFNPEFLNNEILTLEEAANLLRVSKRTMIRLLGKGEICGAKIGGQWRFSRDALLKMIEEGAVLTFDGNYDRVQNHRVSRT